MLNKGHSLYIYIETKPHLTFSYIYVYIYFFIKPEIYQLFPIAHQSSGEELADIQAMRFNATRP